MPQPLVVVLLGPTATGKTSLALELAEWLPLEVVSADSRTVYRWMDIGTAKPSPAEQRRVPHHLLDVVDPDEAFTLAQYQQQAWAAIDRVRARGRLPLLVGGAGLYISAVCDGLTLPAVPPDTQFRAEREAQARQHGWQSLLADLQAVDPVTASRIDAKNVRRVIRALEVFHATGRPLSAWQARTPPAFESVFFGLRVPPETLSARIAARIEGWFAGGFLDEVAALLRRGYAPSLPSMSGIGYREAARVLGGELPVADAMALTQHATRQYARRQQTWFRRDPRITWLDAERLDARSVLDRITPRLG